MQAANQTAARTALGLGTAATQASSAFATAAQGGKADTAIQSADLGSAATKNVGTAAGTVAAGDHIHDERYYTETEVNALLASKTAVTVVSGFGRFTLGGIIYEFPISIVP